MGLAPCWVPYKVRDNAGVTNCLYYEVTKGNGIQRETQTHRIPDKVEDPMSQHSTPQRYEQLHKLASALTFQESK